MARTRRKARASQKINASGSRLFPISDRRLFDAQTICSRQLCVRFAASCKFALTRMRFLGFLVGFLRLAASLADDAKPRQAILERMQHLLQLGKPAHAVTPGDFGVDRFRRRRDRLDQFYSLVRNRQHAAAQVGFRNPALDQATRFQVAQDSGEAWTEQKSDAGELRDLDRIDRSEGPQNPPMLFGQGGNAASPPRARGAATSAANGRIRASARAGLLFPLPPTHRDAWTVCWAI